MGGRSLLHMAQRPPTRLDVKSGRPSRGRRTHKKHGRRPQANHQGGLRESPHRFWQHSADAAACSGGQPPASSVKAFRTGAEATTASSLWSPGSHLPFDALCASTSYSSACHSLMSFFTLVWLLGEPSSSRLSNFPMQIHLFQDFLQVLGICKLAREASTSTSLRATQLSENEINDFVLVPGAQRHL